MKTLTMRTMLSAGLALALVAGVTGVSEAQSQGRGQGPRMTRQGGPGGPGGPGGSGMRAPGLGLPLRQLELSEAQREQMRGINGTHIASFRAIHERERTARRALRESMIAETLDEATVRQRAADVAAIEADALVLQARVHQEMFAVLTPEQQQKARDLRAAGQKRMEERREGRQDRQPRGQGQRPGRQ